MLHHFPGMLPGDHAKRSAFRHRKQIKSQRHLEVLRRSVLSSCRFLQTKGICRAFLQGTFCLFLLLLTVRACLFSDWNSHTLISGKFHWQFMEITAPSARRVGRPIIAQYGEGKSTTKKRTIDFMEFPSFPNSTSSFDHFFRPDYVICETTRWAIVWHESLFWNF